MLQTGRCPELDFRALRTAIRVTVPPTDEPVTVAEAKAQAGYPADDLDHKFRDWIVAARQMIEADRARALITQSAKLYLPRFPANEIELHLCPVQSVESVQYIDTAGALQTHDSALWQTNLFLEPAIVAPVYGRTWPTAKFGTENAVIVSFTSGYGQAPAVPMLARQAILMLVVYWWQNPTAFDERKTDEVNPTFQRVMRLLSWGPNP